MKPFDLKEFLDGNPVIYRDGKKPITSDSNVLLLTTIDRDIKLKGKAIDTPNGWGNLGIGS